MSAASAYQQAVQDGFTNPPQTPNNATNESAGYAYYECRTTAVPVIDTSSAYCLVPGGHKAMDTCCKALGNGTTPQLKPDCYVWCPVNLISLPGRAPLSSTFDAFRRCLADGDASRQINLWCGPGTGASASTISASVSTTPTTTSTMPSTSTTAAAAPTTTRPSQAGLSASRHSTIAIFGLLALQFIFGGAL